MSKRNNKNSEESITDQDVVADESKDAGELPTLENDSEILGDQTDTTPNDVLASVQAERDDLEQKLLRTAADYQNYVKRSAQNIASAEEQALLGVAKSLVTVMDHFDRALDVDTDKTTAQDVLSGLQIVHEELLSTLGKFGVQRIDVEPGDEFDPMKHEAMMRQPVEGIEADHIAQQFQPGYVLNNKTVRPAQVSVAQ